MAQLLQNNLSGVLASGINAAAASMTLVDAANWPAPTGGDYYLVTLIGLNGNGQESLWEIVKVTAKASNTLTIVRAQESTSAASWPAATTVQMRLTAGSVIPGNVAKAGDTMTGALTATGFAGPLNGTVGATTPAAGAFTTLAASSTVTLSGGTANGVLYLNGSKVATSGTALTYNGSALSLYSTVAGLSIQTALNTNQATITLADADGRTAVFRSPNSGSPNAAQIGTTTNHDVAFLYGGSEQMRLTSTGLGIGTSSPSAKLTIAGTAATTSQVLNSTGSTTGATYGRWFNTGSDLVWGIESSAGGALLTGASAYAAVLYTNSAVPLQLGTAGTIKATLDSAGNLGLGVTPSAWNASFKSLQVSNSCLYNNGAADTFLGANFYNDTGGTNRYTTSAHAAAYGQVDGAHQWFTAPSGTAGNAISFTQSMTLDSAGNLGIGTSSPQYKLHVAQSSSAVVFGQDGSTANIIGTNAAGTASQGLFLKGFPLTFTGNGGGGTEQMRLDSSGNLGLEVTPSAWRSASKALQIGQGASFWANTANPYAFMSSNAFLNSSTQDIYIVNGHATTYTQQTGQHIWYTAPSGTAGNAISFTQAMTLDSSGNLGIGTTSPAGKLQVSSNNPEVYITDTSVSVPDSGALYLGIGVVPQYAGLIADFSNDRLNIRHNQATRATFDASGNLGLGVTPSAWAGGYKAFQMTGGGFASDSVAEFRVPQNAFYNGTNWIYVASFGASNYRQSQGAHAWYTAPSGTAGNAISFTQAMTLGGTATPALRVGVTADLSGFNFQAVNQAGFSVHNSGSSATAAYFSAANNVTLTSAGNFAVINGIDGILFGAAATERARITSGGDLLVGTQSGSDVTSGSVNAKAFNNSVGYCLDSSRVGTTDVSHHRFYNGNGQVGSINTLGSATSYNTSSDYRLKDNPQPLTNSGAFIDALQPKTWNWKADGSKGVGFIAHEVQAVSPNTVTGQKDAVDAEGKPVMQAMEYGSAEFIANIIAELQSLRARVAALESN